MHVIMIESFSSCEGQAIQLPYNTAFKKLIVVFSMQYNVSKSIIVCGT